MAKRARQSEIAIPAAAEYENLLDRVSALLEQGRGATVRTTNAILTVTYWEIGRQIVEHEQGGKTKADYGEELLKRLGKDLSAFLG